MAQYRAVIKGIRGAASRLGQKSSGIRADVNGWDIGIRIYGAFDPARGDVFEVYLTGGSNGRHPIKLIGVFSQRDLAAFGNGDMDPKLVTTDRNEVA
jgi:hypothetical protein